MRKMLAVMAAAVALVTWGAQVPASAETLRVGMECTYAPFNYKNADGELDRLRCRCRQGRGPHSIGADLEFVCQEVGRHDPGTAWPTSST